MNETVKNLVSRRSVRRFKPDQLLDRELDEVLAAGLNAPSGRNTQSTRLVVIQDPETIAKLSAMNAVIGDRVGTDPFYGAPTVIVVLGDREATLTWKEDGSLVIGNLLNAAWSMGIGSCWIHRAYQEFESEEGRAMLRKWGIPDRFAGVGHCILGYPDMEAEDLPRDEGRIIRV